MNKIFKSIVIIGSILFLNITLGQNSFNCGHDHVQESKESKLKYLKELHSRIDVKTKSKRIAKGSSNLITIPVVFHLHYNSSQALGTGGNLTDVQVQSLLSEVNSYYTNSTNYVDPSNPYAGVDTEMEFCLAQRDENEKSTSGIVRHVNNMTFTESNIWQWNPNQYLNIYISNYIPGGGGGFSLLPHLAYNDYQHAVYLNAQQGYKGVSLAHEIGHYFGLYHVFEGGCINTNCQIYGDGICDTPPTDQTSNYQCSDVLDNSNICHADGDDLSINNPFRSTSLGGLGDVNDPNLNVMNYTLCASKHYFSPEQKDVMRANLVHYFPGLEASKKCLPLYMLDARLVEIESEFDFSCSNTAKINISNSGSSSLSSLSIDIYINGVLDQSINWIGTLTNGQSEMVSITANGPLTNGDEINIKLLNPNGGVDEDISNNSILFHIGGAQSDFTENFNSGSYSELPNGWTGAPAYNWNPIVVQNNLGDSDGNSGFDNKAIGLSNSGDTLFSPVFSLTRSGSSPSVNYNVAHCEDWGVKNTAYVIYAKTCSQDWVRVDSVLGSSLSSGFCVIKSDVYIPNSSDWNNKTINLSAFSGEYVQLALINKDPLFSNSHNYFFDDFNIDLDETITSTDRYIVDQGQNVYPNPAKKGVVYFEGVDKNEKYDIYTLDGIKVLSGDYNSDGVNVIGLKGMYVVVINNVFLKLIVE